MNFMYEVSIPLIEKKITGNENYVIFYFLWRTRTLQLSVQLVTSFNVQLLIGWKSPLKVTLIVLGLS